MVVTALTNSLKRKKHDEKRKCGAGIHLCFVLGILRPMRTTSGRFLVFLHCVSFKHLIKSYAQYGCMSFAYDPTLI